MPPTPGVGPWPTLEMVAAVLSARTKDGLGNELPTFTSSTQPTDVQVIDLMNTAALDLFACTGVLDDLEALFYEPVSALIAIYTAAMAELSRKPEQVRSERSAYPELMELYKSGKEMVCCAIEEVRGGGEVGGPDTRGLPKFGFPGYDWRWVSPGIRVRTTQEWLADIEAGIA
jgi:hypothetical protein